MYRVNIQQKKVCEDSGCAIKDVSADEHVVPIGTIQPT